MDSPTPEQAVVSPQVLAAVTQATREMVAGDAFIARLAQAIVAEQRLANPYPFAVAVAQLGENYVLVAPQVTEQGNLLALTQVPVVDGQNFTLVVLAKNPEQLNLPRIEGAELDNYALALYSDELPGQLLSRKVVDLAGLDPQLPAELSRQLKQLRLGQAAFFYLNILQQKSS